MRLFRSDRLERLTVISPRAFALIWLVILSLAAFESWGTASLAVSIGLVALGLLVWTLFEYALHRFVFHWEAKWPVIQGVVFITHGNHHVDPGDSQRNMMPPVVSVPVSLAIWGLFVVILGPPGSSAYLGFGIGYVLYDGIHYACHQLPMRGIVLKRLRRHHNRHHYSRREGNYAITAIFWDRVFGTSIPTKRSALGEATSRQLALQPAKTGDPAQPVAGGTVRHPSDQRLRRTG